ncbi:pyridoxine biosynthesis protein [Ascosphaera aggregata]|nr:pyridoxine biosynthesis protein [Ascosphaera aggregata]
MVANFAVGFNVTRGASRIALKPCRLIAVRAASTSTFITQNPYYPLYPSVHQLLLNKGIPNTDITKIRATGPKGRLLKGDVLCHVGDLDPNASLKLAETISKKSHLDLSNIKIAPPPAAPAPSPEKTDYVPPIPAIAGAVEAQAPAPAVETPSATKVSLQISINEVVKLQTKMRHRLGVDIPLRDFILKAGLLANEEIPLSPNSLRRVNDDALYNEILGIQTAGVPRYKRGSMFAFVEPVEEAKKGASHGKVDVIDELAGNKVKKVKKEAQQGKDDEERVLSVTVPLEEKVRGEQYLKRMQELLQDPVKLMAEM